MERIKSIDGLRTLSIILVLIAHVAETTPFEFKNNILAEVILNGALGVRIFFVISGYLITTLLLAENEKKGNISIKHFYIRRVFRIFPVFFTYIFVIIILKITYFPHIFNSYKTPLFAGLFIWNYSQFFHTAPDLAGGWFFGHFWSLAMEEQFYLFWPLLFFFIPKKESLIKLILVIIILMPFLRVLTYILIPETRPLIRLMLPTGGDTILVGCLGALIERNDNFKEKYSKYFENNWLVTASFLFLFIISPLLLFRFGGTYDLTIGMSLGNLCIMMIIFWSVYVPSTFSKILNLKVVTWLGILSYSIYIWQQLFLTNINNIWINKFPQNLLIVLIVSMFSYYIIEKPILKLKNKFKDV